MSTALYDNVLYVQGEVVCVCGCVTMSYTAYVQGKLLCLRLCVTKFYMIMAKSYVCVHM